jgi:hypothetical protein
MVRRRTDQLNRVQKRLELRLKRLVKYVQASRNKTDARRNAEAQAYMILLDTAWQIVEQTRRLNVRRDLGMWRPEPLTFAEEQEIRRDVNERFQKFKKILDDVSRS